MRALAAAESAPERDVLRALGPDAEASLRELQAAAARLADLSIGATELEERAAALARRERELERRRRELDELTAAQHAAGGDLERRQVELAAEAAKLQVQSEALERRHAFLEDVRHALAERERELDARAASFRWRWLVRAWRWRPPLPKRPARACELLFVPTPDGYKLLEQDGVALTPRATLTGLLGAESRFVVSKIAPWPFDGRWCAYLEASQPFEGGAR